MAAEDFAFMLQKRPGAYIFLGRLRHGKPHGPSSRIWILMTISWREGASLLVRPRDRHGRQRPNDRLELSSLDEIEADLSFLVSTHFYANRWPSGFVLCCDFSCKTGHNQKRDSISVLN